jgi:hypothetical protein
MPFQVGRQHLALHESPQRVLHCLHFLGELEIHD